MIEEVAKWMVAIGGMLLLNGVMLVIIGGMW